MIRLITAPEAKPVSLDSVKAQLRLESDYTAEDEYLTGLIDVATNHVETICGRALITQTWEVFINSLADLEKLKLPLGQLQAVNSVKWRDNANNVHVIDDSLYTVFSGTDYGAIYCETSEIYEAIGESETAPEWAYSVEIVCGYGEDSESIPPSIKHAIKLIITDFYENREPVMSANTEKAIDRLLCNYRLRSFE